MKKFRYSLSNLERIQNYQLDRLTVELTELRDQLLKQREIIDNLDTNITSSEDNLIELMEQQPLFWVETREMLHAYLRDLQQKRAKELSRMEVLTTDIARVMSTANAVRRSCTILEKHKEREQNSHSLVEYRKYESAMDEHVLRIKMVRRTP